MSWATSVGLGVALGMFGGCAPRVAYDVQSGFPVERDRIVASWRVNGELVELKSLNPAPGCYVLGVKYSEQYVSTQTGGRATGLAMNLAGPFAAMGAFMAELKHSKYESELVPYALEVHEGHEYWVTATFTGDEFLGRIIETKQGGERVGQIEPAQSVQELRDCAARTPKR
ncbi:MAG TPA: hypothetical protein VJN18_24470 [Polyangiaceae bacterium]|nr:hypothetical protein [Polyangiaceae bacterium]